MATAVHPQPTQDLLPSTFIDEIHDGAALQESPHPERITSRLYGFQKQALTFMMQCEAAGNAFRGGILADEQGLGKTVMTTALVVSNPRPTGEITPVAQLSTHNKYPQPCGASLICCTSAILEQWKRYLEEHAPALTGKIEIFAGCPGGATGAEIRRLATAEVVLATYETLTSELDSMSKSFDSRHDVRHERGLRVSVVDAQEPNPSPLKYLQFWRVVLDEVQKAPGGRQAGRTVRKVATVCRWAVTGTPMEHKRIADLSHLVDFVAGKGSDTEHRWREEVERLRRGERDAVGQLQARLRPFFLRRTKDGLDLGIAVQAEPQRVVFELSLQEKVLHHEFALRRALDHYAAGTAAAAGSDSARAQYGMPQQQVLVDSAQRSLLMPAQWSVWGHRAKQAAEAHRKTMQGRAGRATARAEPALRGMPFSLVGEELLMLREAPDELWHTLLLAARKDAERKQLVMRQSELRELVEVHIGGRGELEQPDLLAMQLLVSVSVIAVKGYYDQTDHRPNRAPLTIDYRQDAMFRAMTCVYNHLCGPGGELHAWARSMNNSDGVQEIFRQVLKYTPLQGLRQPLRSSGRSMPLFDESVRWRDVAPFLGLKMVKVALRTGGTHQYRTAEMYQLDNAAIRTLAQPVADETGVVRRADQFIIGIGRELGDLYEARKEIERAAQRILPLRQIGEPTEFKSGHIYHIMNERVPTGSVDADEKRIAKRWLAKVTGRKGNRAIMTETLHTQLSTVLQMAKATKAAERTQREKDEEAARVRASQLVTTERTRYDRVTALAPRAREPLPIEGSSKIQALVKLLDDIARGAHAGKAIVFTRFGDSEMMAHIGGVLMRHGVGTISLSSEAWWRPEWQGQDAFTLFNDSPESDCRVMLLQLDASAAGLTLTCARHVIFLDVPNSTLLEEQAKARVHRIGQKQTSFVWHLIANDSIDVALRDAADRKTVLQPGEGAPQAVGSILRITLASCATLRRPPPATGSPAAGSPATRTPNAELPQRMEEAEEEAMVVEDAMEEDVAEEEAEAVQAEAEAAEAENQAALGDIPLPAALAAVERAFPAALEKAETLLMQASAALAEATGAKTAAREEADQASKATDTAQAALDEATAREYDAEATAQRKFDTRRRANAAYEAAPRAERQALRAAFDTADQEAAAADDEAARLSEEVIARSQAVAVATAASATALQAQCEREQIYERTRADIERAYERRRVLEQRIAAVRATHAALQEVLTEQDA